MKTHSVLPIQMYVCALACSAVLALGSTAFAAEPPPVAFPDVQHYAALWERSVFTTKDLPSPDAPTGPIFSDNLGLSGMYEVDGQVVAVLIDRTTSQYTEARIGSENEQGIKIRKVHPGATMDKTRVQLQKGDIAGWVTFGDPGAPPPTEQAPASAPQQVQAAQPAHAPAATPLLPPPAPSGIPGIHVAPTPPPNISIPVVPAGNDDVPLPPP
ncbi:hypothetical protein [Brevifollis gellanilyticus]|uniref:Uncharacterized protein n=1 Tax=Brevifollis gellanilyticus TaxID=748831 RepID=A0A512M372_9BACT|nr:hypothetical protein [Brevifollis gellanilyticus]GEP41183.1 hypothetical protein BGE01nite_04740 [Brevifollis gellanilyticus]